MGLTKDELTLISARFTEKRWGEVGRIIKKFPKNWGKDGKAVLASGVIQKLRKTGSSARKHWSGRPIPATTQEIQEYVEKMLRHRKETQVLIYHT